MATFSTYSQLTTFQQFIDFRQVLNFSMIFPCIYIEISILWLYSSANGHITLNIPVLVRSLKSSSVESSQYLDGWPPGNTGCCWHFFFVIKSKWLNLTILSQLFQQWHSLVFSEATAAESLFFNILNVTFVAWNLSVLQQKGRVFSFFS